MFHILSILSGFETAIGKLLLAVILGGIIGWERETRGRPAGLRTHILVCVGVTLMMVVSENMFEKYKIYSDDSVIRIDPARIAAQVVTGIGFLGAGTIMRFKASVRGLTTAASLWVVAGIGLAIGSNCFIPALLTTVIVFFTLFFVPFLEKKAILHNFPHRSVLLRHKSIHKDFPGRLKGVYWQRSREQTDEHG